jgi:YD repeat-containing protein
VGNEEQIGIVESTEYDARMRPVMSALYASGDALAAGQPSRVTVTWLDNLDRERLVAVFDAGVLTRSNFASIDPRTRSVALDVPPVWMIKNAGALSLRETVYDARGMVRERREHEVGVTPVDSYTAQRYGYDAQGRVVWSQSPGGEITISRYDYRGWLEQVETWAAGVPIKRVVNICDAHGNAVEVETLERMHDAPLSAELVADGNKRNAVRTRVFNWYDIKHQLIATAELGTERADDTFDTCVGGLDRSQVPDAPVEYQAGQLVGFSRGALGAALIRCYQYDLQGRQIAMVGPDGSVTRTQYDALGRVTQRVENASASSTSGQQRVTAYAYDSSGRLERIAAAKGPVLNWNPADAQTQVTRVEYGAQLVGDMTGELGTIDAEKIARVYFPDPVTGSPSTEPALEFAYYPTGELRSRRDARTGRSLTFTYDERGNRTQVLADPIGDKEPAGGVAIDQCETTVMTYDPLDRLTSVLSAAEQYHNQLTQIISHNVFSYDLRGNLAGEIQSHGRIANGYSPSVWYLREFQSASADGAAGYDRPLTVGYPQFGPGPAGPAVVYSYGAPMGIDHALNRVRALNEQSSGGNLITIDWAGTDRRVRDRLGQGTSACVATQSVRATPAANSMAGYDHLDRFGRIKNFAFMNASGLQQYGAVLRHDLAGRLTSARVDHAGTGMNNTRSWQFGYDGLDRLVMAGTGSLDANNAVATASGSPGWNQWLWSMDSLGNWSGSGVNPGVQVIGTGDVEPHSLTHELDAYNTIKAVQQTRPDGQGGTTTSTTNFLRDGAGNVLCDGEYVYQYDAFGRLMRVNLIGGAWVEDGALKGDVGDWVKHYTYDGLGRLIRIQTPWPEPGSLDIATERYFYDGHRRITELQSWLIETPEGAPIAFKDQADYELASGLPTWVHRQYYWDPERVDALVAYDDASGERHFVINDVTGSPAVVLTSGGAVAMRQSFDPHGQLIWRQSLVPHAPLGVGFKGQHFDRLDNPLTNDKVVVGATGTYHARARQYSPSLGRFMQPDPRGLGVPVTEEVVWGGMPSGLDVLHPDIAMHLSDGHSTQSALLSNPVQASDPTGLFGIVPGILDGLQYGLNLQDGLDQAYQGNSIAFGLERMVERYAARQILELEWAMDMGANDFDYSRSAYDGVTMWNGATGHRTIRGEVMWQDRELSRPQRPAMVGREPLPASEINAIRGAAAASNHGKFPHYNAMADEVISVMESQGLRLEQVDIMYNRALRVDGKVSSKMKPDWATIAEMARCYMV